VRDGAAWAATAALLGQGRLGPGREALRREGDATLLLLLAREAAGSDLVERCLSSHLRRVR
jgi:hypothetical protein